jgi:hypothetical protein
VVAGAGNSVADADIDDAGAGAVSLTATNWAWWALVASTAPRLGDLRTPGDAPSPDSLLARTAIEAGYTRADPTAEAYTHDPLGAYLKHWVPELSQV